MKKAFILLLFVGGCAGSEGSGTGGSDKESQQTTGCVELWKVHNQARVNGLSESDRVGAYAVVSRQCGLSENDMKSNF